MTPLSGLGKALVVGGLTMAGIGLILLVAPKIPWLGRLPGDLMVKKNGFRLYFPLTTCIIISILLTVLFNIFKK